MPETAHRRLRRTPCIGVCSTTYGDLVCRGCKRFAHEVVGWNGFADAQRHVVWTRLNGLLAESVRAYVTVVDEKRLRSAAPERIPDADALSVEVVAFRTMCARPLPMAALGLAAREPSAGEREGFTPRMEEPSAGEREGFTPSMKQTPLLLPGGRRRLAAGRIRAANSRGDREAVASRMEEPSAGEREGLAPRMEEPSAGERPRREAAGRGVAPRMEGPGGESAAATRETARLIDREFYTRSRAYYEASFKTLT